MTKVKVYWLITNVYRERKHNVGVDVLTLQFRGAHKQGNCYHTISRVEFSVKLQANFGTDPLTGRNLGKSDWYGLRFLDVAADRRAVNALARVVKARANTLAEVVAALRAVYADNLKTGEYYQYTQTAAPAETLSPRQQAGAA